MLCLRRTAFRVLSSTHSKPFLTRSRSITTVTPSITRLRQQPSAFVFQRRWATGEAEVKNEEEAAPIVHEEATPQQEAEAATRNLPDDPVQSALKAEPAESVAQEAAPENEAASQSATSESQAWESQDVERQSLSETIAKAAEAVKEGASGASSEAASYTRGAVRPFTRSPPTDPSPTIYVGNIFFDVTAEDISKEFHRFGTIEDSIIIQDARGLSKGFGYVTFDSVEAATRAIEEMNQEVFEGRRIVVQYSAQKKSKERFAARNPPTRTLFIGNMSFRMTDKDLNELFRDIRNVIDVRVAIDRRSGQPRGFAHADFIDIKSATEALEMLSKKDTYGRRLKVDYSVSSAGAPRRLGTTEEQ